MLIFPTRRRTLPDVVHAARVIDAAHAVLDADDPERAARRAEHEDRLRRALGEGL